MLACGDWDGRPETAECSIVAFFEQDSSAPDFTAMVREFLRIVDQMVADKMAPRAITLDDVIRAKMVFDVYIRLKAQRRYADETAKMHGVKSAIPVESLDAVEVFSEESVASDETS